MINIGFKGTQSNALLMVISIILDKPIEILKALYAKNVTFEKINSHYTYIKMVENLLLCRFHLMNSLVERRRIKLRKAFR